VNASSEWLRNGALKLLFFWLLAALPMARLSAREAPVYEGITVTVTPDTLLVGDRVRCIIGVQHQEDEVATLGGLDHIQKQQMELISRKRVTSILPSGKGKDRFELEFALFGNGNQSLPPFTIELRDRDRKITRTILYTPQISVFVKALTDSTMRELRPIKPPEKPSIPYFLLLPFILFVVVAALVVLLLLFLIKRAVRKSAEKVDPGQVAQRKLRKLGSRLTAGMPPHECYEELSNIMRSYLENHYHIRALEAVTQEIERDLKKIGVAGFESIMNLLKQADLVKFADSRPDIEESRHSLQKAQEVIRSTRPVEE
jgi:NADH:ubiquinone oxidoreductase subunit 3 (subunit A)